MQNEFINIVSAFSLAFLIVFFVFWRGLAFVIVAVLFAIFLSYMVYLFGVMQYEANIFIMCIVFIFGGNLGGVIGYLLNKKTGCSSVLRKIKVIGSEASRDRRIIVIAFSISLSILATFIFRSMAIQEGLSQKFWDGFYQSWTSNIVTFAFLGVAGVIVSLHRPERDNFKNRVHILFGGRSGENINYISESIERLGYYSESNTRTYTVHEYDELHNAYQIQLDQVNVVKNYLHDVNTPDVVYWRVEPDKFINGLETVGVLLSVLVDDKNLLGDTIEIKSGEKYEAKWPITVPSGQSVTIKVSHKLWYKAGEDQWYAPGKFAVRVTTNFIYQVGKGRMPSLSVKTANEDEFRKVSFNRSVAVMIGEARDIRPETHALTFRLEAPPADPADNAQIINTAEDDKPADNRPVNEKNIGDT